jgi:hypothetical protein
MKPQEMLKDEKVLAERNQYNYFKRMRKNKYYKKGYKAAKSKQSKQDNPYKITPEMHEILKKRTLWEMGFDEAWYTPSKKRLREEAERQRERKKHNHESSRHSKNSRDKHRRKDRHSHR